MFRRLNELEISLQPIVSILETYGFTLQVETPKRQEGIIQLVVIKRPNEFITMWEENGNEPIDLFFERVQMILLQKIKSEKNFIQKVEKSISNTLNILQKEDM